MGRLEWIRKEIISYATIPGEAAGQNAAEAMKGVAVGISAIAEAVTLIPGEFIDNTVESITDNLPTIVCLILVIALVIYLMLKLIGNPFKGVGPSNVTVPVVA